MLHRTSYGINRPNIRVYNFIGTISASDSAGLSLTMCALQIYLLTYFTHLSARHFSPQSVAMCYCWSQNGRASWLVIRGEIFELRFAIRCVLMHFGDDQ